MRLKCWRTLCYATLQVTKGCQQLVLVGDHCQLPPTIISDEAERMGLSVPLFTRLVHQGVQPLMLDTQYRMHPQLAESPSDLFYAGRLLSGVVAAQRPPPLGFAWPQPALPVAFIPVEGQEHRDSMSYCNHAEAAAAVQVVRGFLTPHMRQMQQSSRHMDNTMSAGLRPSDVGVITPYAGQARVLRISLQRSGIPLGADGVEVSSVDGFQGREKEVIVFSAVRANQHGLLWRHDACGASVGRGQCLAAFHCR